MMEGKSVQEKGTVSEGDNIRVEGRHTWDPDEWTAEVRGVCVTLDDEEREGYVIVTHPKEHVGRVTRDFSEVRRLN